MASASEKMSTLVDDLIRSLTTSGVTLNDTQRTTLYDTAATWLAGQANESVPLAANKPEFQQLLVQFQYALETSGAWSDANTAATGRTILRFMAAGVDRAIQAAERTLQERHHYTAKLPSAIKASTLSLGVRLRRRTPANVKVSLYRDGLSSLQLPKYTSFVINGHRYFNRETIFFAADIADEVQATLYQGTVSRDTYLASGAAYARFEIGNSDWTLSDEDIVLKVDGVEWSRELQGLVTAGPLDRKFAEKTLPNGNVEIMTGSGTYGVLPSASSTLEITYVSTLGAQVSNNATDLPVRCVDVAGVLGATVSVISGGIDPETATFYKINAPAMAARNARAVRRVDYDTSALEFSGAKILDARFLGQEEIDPTRKAYTNVLQVALLTAKSLTGAPVNSSEWAAFVRYMKGEGIGNVEMYRTDPTAVDISLEMEVGCLPETDLDKIKSALIALYRSFYGPRRGALGRKFLVQDLTALYKDANLFDENLAARINYIKPAVSTPEEITVDRLEWLRLDALEINPVYTSRDYSSRETGLSG